MVKRESRCYLEEVFSGRRKASVKVLRRVACLECPGNSTETSVARPRESKGKEMSFTALI